LQNAKEFFLIFLTDFGIIIDSKRLPLKASSITSTIDGKKNSTWVNERQLPKHEAGNRVIKELILVTAVLKNADFPSDANEEPGSMITFSGAKHCRKHESHLPESRVGICSGIGERILPGGRSEERIEPKTGCHDNRSMVRQRRRMRNRPRTTVTVAKQLFPTDTYGKRIPQFVPIENRGQI
jgi:hypothetical protein